MAALTVQEIEALQGALGLVANFLPAGSNGQKYLKDFAADGPLFFEGFTEIKVALAGLPPRAVRTAVDIVLAFGVPAGTPAHTLAKLFDTILGQADAFKNPAPVPASFAAVNAASGGFPTPVVVPAGYPNVNPNAAGYPASPLSGLSGSNNPPGYAAGSVLPGNFPTTSPVYDPVTGKIIG